MLLHIKGDSGIMKTTFKKIAILALTVVILSLTLTSCVSRGTVWHYGDDAPGEELEAKAGDFYMNTESGDVYVLEEEGWKAIANLNGEDGKDGTDGVDGTNGTNGSNWLYGNTAPAAADGIDGDFWLDTVTLKMYKKTSGAWSLIADFNK